MKSGSLMVKLPSSLFTQTRERGATNDDQSDRRTGYTATAPTPACLYLAFELRIDEWKLGFATALGATLQVRRMPARDRERLRREIADAKQWFGVKAATPVRSCNPDRRDQLRSA